MKRNGASVDLDNGERMKKLQLENDKLRQMVDRDLVLKLEKENAHLKRAL